MHPEANFPDPVLGLDFFALFEVTFREGDDPARFTIHPTQAG
jgi:hypothetical protein